MKVHLDFEACSELDLKKVGGWRWTEDPSTQPICYAFAIDDKPVVSVVGGALHPDLWAAVQARAEIHAWNAPFEFAFWHNVMTARYGWPLVPVNQFHCTMATAANYGLPMSLDQAGQAIGSPHLKDKTGSLLMKRMARPRSTSPTVTWWHETDAQKVQTLVDYNIDDVEAERAIARRIPDMTAGERRVWLCDQRMNLRGFAVDHDLLDRLQTLTDAEMVRLNLLMSQATAGQVKSVTQVGKLMEWLRAQGLQVESIAKGELADLLSRGGLPADVRQALKIRQEAAKSSTAKINTMREWAVGGRIRNMVQYYGANRTGRWAGRGPQVQNFPRGNVKHIDHAIEAINAGAGADEIGDFYGKPLDVVSAALRGCLRGGVGRKLAVCDFSQIEARVVAWLAGQNDILAVFASGEDVYVYTAAKIGSTERQLGKVAVLGLGFGMGAAKFVDAALVYGITLAPERSQEVVTQWREANDKIVQLWWNCDRAARSVIEGRVPRIFAGRVEFSMGADLLRGCMLITLPSGRQLVYRNARLEAQDGKIAITFDGLDQYTRKWGPIRTYGGKLVENITQAVARDLMSDSMVEMEGAGIELVGTIHDEVIAEAPSDTAINVFKDMKQIMSKPRDWAVGLPLGGEGFVSKRYKKG